MKIVADDGTILAMTWKVGEYTYKIIATKSTGRNTTVWQAVDTIIRSDGRIKDYTREGLKKYFNSK